MKEVTSYYSDGKAGLFRLRHDGSWIYPSIAGMALILMAFMFTGHYTGDYANYYFSGQFLREGSFHMDIYEPILFNQRIQKELNAPVFLNHTPVPPSSALFYVPFSYFPFYTSKLIWNIFTSLFFTFSLYRLLKAFRLKGWLLPLLVAACIIPLKTNFYLGQSYLLVVAFMAEGILAYQEDRKLGATVFWSLAILLKVFPAVVLIFLLKKKDYRTMVYIVLLLLLITILSFLFISPPVWLYYVEHVLPRLMNGEINDPYALNYQSMDVFLRRLFLRDDVLHPYPLIFSPPLYAILLISFKLVMVWLYACRKEEEDNSNFFSFGTVVLLGMIISGYGSMYGYLQLILVFLMIPFERRPVISILFTCFIFLLLSLPIAWLSMFPLALAMLKMYVMVGLFIYLSVPVYHFNKNSLVFILPFVFIYIGGAYFRSYKQPVHADLDPPSLLAYGMQVNGQSLQIWYHTPQGETIHSVPLLYEIENIKYGPGISGLKEQLPGSVTINGKYHYYLSDEGRGVGLYAVVVDTKHL